MSSMLNLQINSIHFNIQQVSSEDESQDIAPKLPPRGGIPTALTVTSQNASNLATFVMRSEPVADKHKPDNEVAFQLTLLNKS